MQSRLISVSVLSLLGAVLLQPGVPRGTDVPKQLWATMGELLLLGARRQLTADAENA